MRDNIVVRQKLCLCCGAPGASLYKTRDGRWFSSCDKCAFGCDECVRTLEGSARVAWADLTKPQEEP